GQKTIAVAPEAGTERLRRVINKHLSQEQILRTAGMIARIGVFDLRLYFLVGLPTETDEDVDGVLTLVRKIKHHVVKESGTRGRMGGIRLSVNCFVPKPSTPFQWFPMETLEVLKDRQNRIKRALGREGGVRVSFDVPKWAYLQALLSMGDRRVGQILLLGHRFGENWARAYRHSELNPDFFVYRPKDPEETLPWDFIDLGIRKEHLLKEYRLALKARESDTCHVGACDRCGVCRGIGGM
ncbi:MAG: radical SAM protein, partial [Deltaproteobacteria bacterium]|nr:radical SAM protein [Deltaproteobacteria bacterium]